MLEDVEGDLETDLEGNPYGRDVKEEDSIGDDAASKVNFCILCILYFSILYLSKLDSITLKGRGHFIYWTFLVGCVLFVNLNEVEYQIRNIAT